MSDIFILCDHVSSPICLEKHGNHRENEGMNEEWRVVDERTTDVPSYNTFNMWTVSSDVSIQRRHWQPLSVHLWAYCTHSAHDVNDNDVWRLTGWPQHRGLHPLLFSNCSMMDLYLQPKHSSWSKLIMGLSATTFLLKGNSANTINTNLSSKSLRIQNQ